MTDQSRPDEPLRAEVRRNVTNAYYDARNKGETMETAADWAADRVMDSVVAPLIRERDAIAEDEAEARSAGAAALDVERLARALGLYPQDPELRLVRAHVIAAKYARLRDTEGDA